MKHFFAIIMITSTLASCYAQTNKSDFTYDNFEKNVIDYQPKQVDLSDKDYNYGLMILSEVKKDVKNNPNNFNRADYFNVLSSFLTLKENKKIIKIAFDKFKNAEGSCEYFLSEGMFKTSKYDDIREEINKQISNCQNSSTKVLTSLNLDDYTQKNDVDINLIKLVDKISKLDKEYRRKEVIEWSKQTLNDNKNQNVIDSLYRVHKTYIGKSLVGEKFENVMWAVIQHSNLEMMERYLPIIQKAVSEEELNKVPFKMLIDRFYGLKYGYQIFGSQSGFGFKLADDRKRKEIELKYGID